MLILCSGSEHFESTDDDKNSQRLNIKRYQDILLNSFLDDWVSASKNFTFGDGYRCSKQCPPACVSSQMSVTESSFPKSITGPGEENRTYVQIYFNGLTEETYTERLVNLY